MPDKVFSVTGNKISSFIADENALKFSSSTYDTVDNFREAFAKKLSLATKVEVKYDTIKSITKEDSDKRIKIKYKTWAGIPAECEFSFTNENDYEVFFNFLETGRYFTKTQVTLTPFKAARNYAISLVATIAFSIFAYYQAIAINNGTVEKSSRGRTRLFNNLIELLGDKGVIAVGSLIACFLLYKIWTRFSAPPIQIKFTPPHS